MFNRYLILLMSTLLLVEVATAKSTEISDSDASLCNNPVIDSARIQILKIKNQLLDGFLRIFKGYLENARHSLSSSIEMPVNLTEGVTKFVRDMEIVRSMGVPFDANQVINEAMKLAAPRFKSEDFDNFVRSSWERMGDTVRQFGVNFEKFAATVSSEERGRYEALFAFQRKFDSDQDVKIKFSYLDELDQECPT